MKITFIISILFLSIICKKNTTEHNFKTISDSTELILLVDAKYVIAHNWGYVFKCEVKEVKKGELDMDTIFLNVYATVDGYNGLLSECSTYQNLTISFNKTDRLYGPPPGFRDEKNIWWEIISVSE
jgi:hypothetical protein